MQPAAARAGEWRKSLTASKFWATRASSPAFCRRAPRSFVLTLCDDRAALGPWNNGKAMNAFAGAAIAVPVKRSGVLTALVLFPDAIDVKAVGFIVAGCDVFACVAAG
jgi:hypothetical protein